MPGLPASAVIDERHSSGAIPLNLMPHAQSIRRRTKSARQAITWPPNMTIGDARLSPPDNREISNGPSDAHAD